MADVKISALPAATVINTTDTLALVQAGTTKKAAVSLLPGITPDGWINVALYGTNQAGMEAAAVACQATINPSLGSKGLWFPPGYVYTLTDQLDLSGISQVRMEGSIVFSGVPVLAQGPCIICAIESAAYPGDFYFQNIQMLNVTYQAQLVPTIEFRGIRGRVYIGECNGWINCQATPGVYASMAYVDFRFNKAWRFEIHGTNGAGGASTGWINSNRISGGAYEQIRIGGAWIQVTSIVSNVVTTTTPHGFSSGNVVEMYNGTPSATVFNTITVTGASTFTIPGTFAGGGWRCMGPSGYPHNHNIFDVASVEGPNIIIHIQGQFTNFRDTRTEGPGGLGRIVFGAASFGNRYSASNSDHGQLPVLGEYDITPSYFGTEGKNYVGWELAPVPYWGAPNQLLNPIITNYVETQFAPAAGSSFTVNLANGTKQKFITNGNTTVTLPASVAGKAFVIEIQYGGVHTLTFAGGSTIKWAGGVTPTGTAVNGKKDVFGFTQDGTDTLGSIIGQNF